MRAIWMKIPLEKARYIGPAVEEYHFVFHHAEEVRKRLGFVDGSHIALLI